MRDISKPSRRTVVSSLVVAPMITTAAFPEELHSDDAELIALGRQFDDVAAKIDQAIDHKSDLTMDTLNQLGMIESYRRILVTRRVRRQRFELAI